MKILITGGAGFIGSHLAEKLLAHGHQIVAFDNLSTGSKNNIEQLMDRGNDFVFVEDTIFNARRLEQEMKNCQAVIHLAAAVGVKLIVAKPIETILTNIRGTEIVLELADKQNKRILLASTSEIYGKNNKVPFSEEDDMVLGPTTKNRWSYACSKAIDEFLALAYYRQKNTAATILRFFNIAGPRQSGEWGMVLPTFVEQALKNQPLTVYGDGKQQRCFCHVLDCCEYIVRLLKEEQSFGEVYNIGNPEEVTILQLAEQVISLCHSNSTIEMISYENAYESGFEDMQRRFPEIGKVVKATDFKPKHNLQQIISSVIDYYRHLGND